MLDSFPYVTLWTTELHEMLLVGSLQPLPLDLQGLAERLEQQPAMAQSLTEVGINSPEALLATYMMDQQGLAVFAGSAPPITDDDPRLEYDRWTSKRVLLDILPQLLAEQTTVDSVPAGRAAGYRFEQEKLLAFYYAGLASYAGDLDTWQEMMKRLNRADQDNRYYAWFRGDG
jgi:spermidine synthase